MAEPLLIGEMLSNLIANALAYAGHGAEVTVRIREDGQNVFLIVEDNGPGIAPERRGIVRQRFARGEQNPSPGLGLGLPIVEEIANLFNAKLTLQDTSEGRGLTVSVTFPNAATAAHA